jgi:hypothetical protein
MIGLNVVDHVMPLFGQVGADQTAVLLLPHPAEILAQTGSIIS